MRVLLQDVAFALRQLRKTPGFTATVLLTLALGIGANSAIFTLVNAILLHNLPVADPKTLVRIGDKDDCCVNGGWNDEGDYSLFATDTYYMFKKSLPEFEELAAMEAGYAWRPVTVRRAGGASVAKSEQATFVSGNYFRVFGLSPAVGRFFVDADDQKGAPITAVMSYDAWRQDFAGDPKVVGSTFYVNTKPVTISSDEFNGCGDRRSVLQRSRHAVGVHHRAREARHVAAGVAGEGQRLAQAAIYASEDFYGCTGAKSSSPHARGAYPGRRRYPEHAGWL
jgi:hypothetical protein